MAGIRHLVAESTWSDEQVANFLNAMYHRFLGALREIGLTISPLTWRQWTSDESVSLGPNIRITLGTDKYDNVYATLSIGSRELSRFYFEDWDAKAPATIKWTELTIYDSCGNKCEYPDETFIRKMREYHRTGGMADYFFTDENREDAWEIVPTEEIDWSGINDK